MSKLSSALWDRIKSLFATPARTVVMIAAAAFVGPWEGGRTEA